MCYKELAMYVNAIRFKWHAERDAPAWPVLAFEHEEAERPLSVSSFRLEICQSVMSMAVRFFPGPGQWTRAHATFIEEFSQILAKQLEARHCVIDESGQLVMQAAVPWDFLESRDHWGMTVVLTVWGACGNAPTDMPEDVDVSPVRYWQGSSGQRLSWGATLRAQILSSGMKA